MKYFLIFSIFIFLVSCSNEKSYLVFESIEKDIDAVLIGHDLFISPNVDTVFNYKLIDERIEHPKELGEYMKTYNVVFNKAYTNYGPDIIDAPYSLETSSLHGSTIVLTHLSDSVFFFGGALFKVKKKNSEKIFENVIRTVSQ